MKKILSLLLILALSLSLLAGCSAKTSENNEIKIGVSPNPHKQLVSLVLDELKEQGIDVKIIEFTDYVQPNLALDAGDLDANFFQHGPYFEKFIQKEDLDLVSLGNVHIEPMALYSNDFTSVDDLKDGAKIAIPNDTVNGGRALILLENNGLLKLKKDAGLEATENDIVENPHNFKITALEAAALPTTLQDVDAAVINGNYALDAGLNPLKDGLIIEDGNSPYANLIAVRKGEENEDKFVKLLKALQSDKVKKYIEETYNGGVAPAL